MHSDHSSYVRALMTAVFAAAFAAAPGFAAQAPQHLISPNQLQQSTVVASQARQKNMNDLRQILSTPQAQEAFQRAHVSPERVNKAVAGLSDQELSQLANRARTAQKQFAAGAITNEELILILLAVILIVVIIIAA